jgi:hypothetical protein
LIIHPMKKNIVSPPPEFIEIEQTLSFDLKGKPLDAALTFINKSWVGSENIPFGVEIPSQLKEICYRIYSGKNIKVKVRIYRDGRMEFLPIPDIFECVVEKKWSEGDRVNYFWNSERDGKILLKTAVLKFIKYKLGFTYKKKFIDVLKISDCFSLEKVKN